MSNINIPQYYSVSDVKKILNYKSSSTVYSKIRANKLQAICVDGRYRISNDDLLAYMEQNRIKAANNWKIKRPK